MPDKYKNSQKLPPVAARRDTTLGAPLTASRTCLNEPPDSSSPLSLKQAETLVGILLSKRALAIRLENSQQISRPSDQVVARIKAIVMTKDEAGLADYLSGEAAQILIDVTTPGDFSHLSPRLRRECLGALYRICGRLALLPRSLQIPLCFDRSGVPRYRGGCADVWKSEYRGQPVAAKVVRIYSTSDLQKMTRRFCKEVMTWNSLNHSNVLPLLGVTMDGQQFVMVSEWMENGNINQFIEAHKDANRLELLKDVAKGLIYMHDQDMVHGDLKGANILVDPNGHARLADFGFLAFVSDPTNPTGSSSFVVGGTIRWMSPELFCPDNSGLKGARPTKQSDCYAFGMVIYEVLSGQAPFTQYHYCIVMWKVIQGERPGKPNGPEGRGSRTIYGRR